MFLRERMGPQKPQQRQAVLTKTVRFEAAHQLPGHLGKCANLHGHSYTLEVSLRGPIKQAPGASDDGMVMDLQELSSVIERSVLQRLDHQFLNEVIGVRSTAENLVYWIWHTLLAGGLPAGLLYRLRLWETATGSVEITQEEWAEAGQQHRYETRVVDTEEKEVICV